MLIYTIELLFTVYTFLLLARVIGSWFPRFASSSIMRFISFYTDPYLDLFKKIIPPIGMIDISPMFAFIGLQVAQYLIIYLIGSLF